MASVMILGHIRGEYIEHDLFTILDYSEVEHTLTPSGSNKSINTFTY